MRYNRCARTGESFTFFGANFCTNVLILAPVLLDFALPKGRRDGVPTKNPEPNLGAPIFRRERSLGNGGVTNGGLRVSGLPSWKSAFSSLFHPFSAFFALF